MSKSRRAIELTKTVIILLLTVSAVLLAWRTGLFSDIFQAFPVIGDVAQLVRGTPGTPAYNAGAAVKEEAARPISIVITNEQGGRFGVRNDKAVRNAVYERASSIIGEALGSASTPVQISVEQWREALSGPGVFFEYITPVRLSVLDGWLGSRMPYSAEDAEIRRIFVSFGEERNRIYFQEHYSGLFFGADTASAAGKAQELAMYLPNGAMFAFETQLRGSENAPYMLIMPGVYYPDVRSASAGSREEMLESALVVFGHRNEVVPTYPSGDELVSAGTQFNIRVHPDGTVVYRRTDGFVAEAEMPELSLGEMIEKARAIVSASVGAKAGDAEVAFEAIEYSSGVYSVYFGYYIAGGRVYLYGDRHAAVISFSSGTISEAELNFRNFTFTNTYTRLLPEKQALAAAGGEFILNHSDIGQEILAPSWVRVWF